MIARMEENIVEQTNNTVGGDQAGRDVNKPNTVVNYHTTYTMSNYLQTLYVNFKKQETDNTLLKSFIEDLDYYNSQIENETIIGLEAKLIAGNKANIVWYAKDVKERYHKKLLKTSQFSEAAQKINVYLLAIVRSYYMLEIYPLVCNGEAETFINLSIQERIIKPLMVELGDNLLSFTHDDIQGMLYFLTGNCHIKWTR